MLGAVLLVDGVDGVDDSHNTLNRHRAVGTQHHAGVLNGIDATYDAQIT